MESQNVTTWEVSPSAAGDGVVTLEIDGLFEFRLSPAQAIKLSASLSTAAKAASAHA